MLLLKIAFVISSLCITVQGRNFRVANTFSDNMVLQQGPIRKAQIWGFGSEPFAEISLEVNSATFYATVGQDLKWRVQLDPQPAGGPHKIAITQTSISGRVSETIFLKNILFGDVWLCIGEANMEFKMQNIFDASQEMEEALLYSNRIRIGHIYSNAASFEKEEAQTFWLPLNESRYYLKMKDFSATCLLYGIQLAKILNDERPIGLITAVSLNSPIETWSSRRVTDQCHTPKPPNDDYTTTTSNNALWNGTIYPLTKTSIGGVIWSQGESNIAYNNELYSCHLKYMIIDYSKAFCETNPANAPIVFPFGIVQLGAMTSGRNEQWSRIRWAQTLDMGYLPIINDPNFKNVFMATTYDLTDRDSPFGSVLTRDKKTIAIRLANAAGALLYNTSSQAWLSGPFATSASRGASGFVGLTFSKNVTVNGTEGFVYSRRDRVSSVQEWKPAPKFLQISGTKIGVAVPEDATQLAYAWGATVCEKHNCALYADDQGARLPVQPWIWQISGSTIYQQ